MNLNYFPPFGFFAAVTAASLWYERRRAKKLAFYQREELEVGQVNQPGFAKVYGLVEVPDPILAPFSNKPCAWYRVLIQEYVRTNRASYWRTIHSSGQGRVFHLKDRKGEGRVEVDPAGAEIRFASEGGTEHRESIVRYLQAAGITSLLGFGELRAAETTLEAGEKLFVMGTVRQGVDRYRISAGTEGPCVISDEDVGQLAYQESQSMYQARFLAGFVGLMALYFGWHLIR